MSEHHAGNRPVHCPFPYRPFDAHFRKPSQRVRTANLGTTLETMRIGEALHSRMSHTLYASVMFLFCVTQAGASSGASDRAHPCKRALEATAPRRDSSRPSENRRASNLAAVACCQPTMAGWPHVHWLAGHTHYRSLQEGYGAALCPSCSGLASQCKVARSKHPAISR